MMINEIKKPNDIFVSVLTDPSASITNLMASGLNVDNTGLLSPEQYKLSDFVKKQFTDQNGKFQDDKFNQAYEAAALRYQAMSGISGYKDLEKYIQYSSTDVLAPLGAMRKGPELEIAKIPNPMKVSRGVKSFWEEGTPSKSQRELAQMHKIWDTENNQWMDHTADELGLFGTIFSLPLVYAIYDEDVFDEQGRKIHQKGEWKTDENGEFYTETIGTREGYGKQFVSASDTLTREDSFWNKIDVFDSDDIEKSAAGTIVKTALQIAPYIFPQINEAWGGIVAAMQLAKVMPSFAKVLDGLAFGDGGSYATSTLNLLENYASKFNASYSDQAQGKPFGFEQLASTVADVFGLLYQMNAMASLSKYSKLSVSTAQKEALARFESQFGAQIAAAKQAGNFVGDAESFYFEMFYKSPIFKELTHKQSELAKRLSLGYMALTSSADVYGDAIEGGYDRRTAGFAALIATLGQYRIMLNNPMGDWFLRATTGYTEKYNRAAIKKIMSGEYERIASQLGLTKATATVEEKLQGFAKIWNPISKKFASLGEAIVNGSEDFWKRSLIEGVEEVTEEAVMDATKGIFDTLTYFGLGNKDASFGGWDNVFSKSGLERYIMNFVGGVLGGALFEAQGRYIQPFMKGQAIKDPYADMSVNHMLQNGWLDILLKENDKIADHDRSVAAIPLDLDGKSVIKGAESGEMTRGEIMKNIMREYLIAQNSLIKGNDLAVSDQELFQKAIRDRQVTNILEEQHIDKLVTLDYTKAVTEFTNLKNQIDAAKAANPEANVSELESQAKEKLKYIQEFLNGEYGEKYLKQAFILSNGIIRSKLLGALNIDQFSLDRYGIRYRDINDSSRVTKEQVKSEHDAFLSSAEPWKYITDIQAAFDIADLTFSGTFLKYDLTRYTDVRQYTLSKLLASMNFLFNYSNGYYDPSDPNTKMDPEYRNFLLAVSQSLHEEGVPGISLRDMLQIDPKLIAEKIIKSEFDQYKGYFRTIADTSTAQGNPMTEDEVANVFLEKLAAWVSNIPAMQIGRDTVNNAIAETNSEFAAMILQSMRAQNIELNRENVDAQLLTMGLMTDARAVTENEDQLVEYFFRMSTPVLTEFNEKVDLNQIVLSAYLENQSQIDSELFKNFKQYVLQLFLKFELSQAELKETIENIQWAAEYAPNILEDGTFDISIPISSNPANATYEEFVNGEVYNLTIPTTTAKLLSDKALIGLNANLTIDLIVTDFLFNPSDGLITSARKSDDYYQKFELKVPEAADLIKQALVSKLMENPILQTYEATLGKQIIPNPLYDVLSNIDFEITGEQGNGMLWKMLQDESQYLSTLSSIDKYKRQGVTMDNINKALDILDIATAIVAAMDGGDLELGDHLFGMNQQIAKYLTDYKEGKNAEKYAILSSRSASTIMSDLNMIKNKLLFIKYLSETNNKNKAEENKKTELAVHKVLIDKLLDAGSKLTIKGISFCPVDVLDLLKNEAIDIRERLAKAEHMIRQNLKSVLTKENAELIAEELITKLDLDADAILKANLSSHGFNQNTNSISDYDLLVYLTSILSVDQFDFQYLYKKIIEKDTKNTPIYIQEYATKIGYAFYKDLIGLHDAIVAKLFEKANKPALSLTTKIFFLNGVSGVGKTSVVANYIAQMLDSTERIGIVAPAPKQVANLAASITSNLPNPVIANSVSLKVKDLLKKIVKPSILSKLEIDYKAPDDPSSMLNRLDCELIDGTEVKTGWIFAIDPTNMSIYNDTLTANDLPTVIFIDEATHVNSVEYQILDFIANKFGIKIFTFGDTIQRSAKIGNTQQHIDTVFRWGTPRLSESMRPSDEGKLDNTSILQTYLNLYELFLIKLGSGASSNLKAYFEDPRTKVEIPIKYYEKKDDNFTGDKLVEGFETSQVDQNLVKLKKSAQKRNSKIGILTELDASGKILDQDLLNALQIAGITSDMYEAYSPEDFHNKAVQGSEEEFFIINTDDSVYSRDGSNLGEDLITFYTYSTRSLRGSLIKMTPDRARALHLLNVATEFQLDYSSIYGEDLLKLKLDKLDLIQRIIGSYIPRTTAPVPTSVPSTPTSPTPVVTPASVSSAPVVTPTPTPSSITTPEPELEPEPEIRTPPSPMEEIIRTEEEKLKDDALAADPEKVIETAGLNAGESEVPSSDGSSDFIMYEFYNHLGLNEKTPGESWKPRTDGPNIDLQGLFKGKDNISKEVVLGFIKLNNLLSLYKPGTVEFDLTIQNPKSNEILTFIREAIPGLDSLSDTDLIEWIKVHIEVDPNEYAIAIKMDRAKDKPTFKFGYKEDMLIKDGDPLIMYAKLISFKGTDFKQYFTQAAFPKEETVSKAVGAGFIDSEAGLLFRSKMEEIRQDLESSNFVIYTLPNAPEFRTKGRILSADSKNEFHSLQELIESGISVEQIGLITADKEGSEYKFVKFMKQFNSSPTVDEILLDDKKEFTAAGKYYAVVSFEGSNNKTYKRVLILDTKDHTPDEVLKWIHDGNLTQRLTLGKLLSEHNQTQIMLTILDQAQAFDNPAKVLAQLIKLRDRLDKGNGEGKVTRQVNRLTNLINYYTNALSELTRENLEKDLNSSQSNLIGAYFIKIFTKRDSITGKVISNIPDASGIYNEVTFGVNDVCYYNFYPSGNIKSNGTFDIVLEDGDFNLIGLRGHYFEMPNINLSSNMLKGMTKLTTESVNPIIPIESVTPKPVTPKSINMDFQSALEKELDKVGYTLEGYFQNPETLSKLSEIISPEQLKSELGFSEEDGIFVKNPRRSLGKQIKQILDEDDNYITTCE